MGGDELGAFCPGPRVEIEGAKTGPVSGLAFAAKDVFDVQGQVTGAGNPDWKRTHALATETARAVSRLVDAGARLVGKTQMDELAYGALGENAHYGTPTNPRAPDRVPGGSSSGSASAVAGGLVDFALGSDSACSVRLPAAACGLYGIRPTLGAVSTRGMVPLSPSLDTVGWLARDPDVLAKVGGVLLEDADDGRKPEVVLWAEDAAALADARVLKALEPAIEALGTLIGRIDRTRIVAKDSEFGLAWFWYRVWSVQVREVWATHGAWVEAAKPDSTVLTPENFSVAVSSTPSELREARAHWAELALAVRTLVRRGALLVLPTTSGVAPKLASSKDAREAFVRPSLCLLSVAGVAGLPQVTLPAAEVDGCPVGLSIVGPPRSDRVLLRIARELAL